MEEIKVSNPNASTSSTSQPSNKQVVKSLNPDSGNSAKMNLSTKTIVILLVVVLLGVGTGYGIYAKKTQGTVQLAGKDVKIVKTANEEGVEDASTFRDTATGLLQINDGKITDEGTNVLVRGDASQNVYLTSSVVDLSKYVGKKVQVWGQTYEGQKAGWLMDVGRVKAL